MIRSRNTFLSFVICTRRHRDQGRGEALPRRSPSDPAVPYRGPEADTIRIGYEYIGGELIYGRLMRKPICSKAHFDNAKFAERVAKLPLGAAARHSLALRPFPRTCSVA